MCFEGQTEYAVRSFDTQTSNLCSPFFLPPAAAAAHAAASGAAAAVVPAAALILTTARAAAKAASAAAPVNNTREIRRRMCMVDSSAGVFTNSSGGVWLHWLWFFEFCFGGSKLSCVNELHSVLTF